MAKNESWKKFFFMLGLIANLGLLGVFKYYDFFVANFNYVTNLDIDLLGLALPLGISFYTLQQIGYLVDCYQGDKPESNLMSYSLFVLFFPQLIAGPIVHSKEILPQFRDETKSKFNLDSFVIGIFIFSIGLFKKVVIADGLSPFVINLFSNTQAAGFSEAWIGAISYTFQIYFDFSGYSDMAVGLGRMFNIVIPWNFNSPYKAKNLIDFWKRWHLTLTGFISTYVFTPFVLRFKKSTFNIMLLGIFLSMFVSGIWHGANWTFVVWGMFHGLGLIVNHIWKKRRIPSNQYLSHFVTFIFLVFSFVLFRSRDITEAFFLMERMVDLSNLSFSSPHKDHVTLLMIATIICVFPSLKDMSERFKPSWTTVVVTVVAFVVSIINLNKESEFIYFNF